MISFTVSSQSAVVFLRQEPVHADKRKLSDEDKERNRHLRKGEKPVVGLRDWLNDRKANGIIFTTMQKFEESFECLSERRNIIVMADEDAISKGAHAGNMIKEIAKLVGGGGGGRPKYGSGRWKESCRSKGCSRGC